MKRRASGLAVSALVCVGALATGQESRSRPTTMAHRSTVYAPHGTIATSQPLATAAGIAVLEHGGNAIDAAVTAAAVLNVVEPMMTGIGGDMFAIVWSAKDHRLYGLNSSGRAGRLMTREALLARGHRSMPELSVEDVTVPGALAGWDALLQRFGTITLAQALAPAIGYAESGFPVTPIIARDWASEASRLARDAGARQTFLVDGTRAPHAGEWFTNPDLARSFRLIAAQGPSALYGGELGQRIVAGLERLGGYLTLDDLRDHRPEWVEPISAPFKGYRVWELPPNGQGVAALEMLRMLEPYDLRGLGHNSAPYLHLLIEAKKLAFADAARYVGEPAAMQVSAAALLDDGFVAARRALIDPKRAADRPEAGTASASETIYLTVADSAGNMVSFINSLFDAFGSGVAVPGTGFALQDRGAGFTLDPGLPNTIAPGKRPFHTLIPAFVTKPDGNGVEQPWMSFGVMGGSMQPQGHVQVLLNLLVFDMDLQDAIDAPRFRHLAGRRVALEAPIGDAARRTLTALGHEIADERAVAFGGAQAIIRLPHGYAAGSDPRKDGMAAGY
ncbi:MAG TPA: gamma-glutamyltransferase [Gemmatimonadales bacterium]|nr:gamma-glutamyltransferase [Gemmatimonadales bacterium]